MATLYDASKTGRKVLFGFLIFTLLVLVIETISNAQQAAILTPTNTARYYMNPDRAFGDISRPNIPGISLDSSVTPSYSLESVFTVLPDVAYVYKIDKPREKLGSFEAAQTSVNKLGFNPLVYTTDNNLFTWETASGTKVIKYDKENLTWSMTTDYTNNIEAKRIKTLNNTIDPYERSALSLIKSLGFDTTGFDTGLVDARFAKYNNGTFFNNDNPAEADYVVINIFRNLSFADLKPTDELPQTDNKALIPKPIDAYVYTADPRIGEIHVIASNKLSDYKKDVFELNFTDYEYSIDSNSADGLLRGSYLIITPEEAWTKIQQGQGSLVSLIPQSGNYFGDQPDTVSVRKFVADRSKTLLGYYEPKDWTGYVYPIYIFKGRAEMNDGRQAEFTYYIEAIKRVE